MCCQATIRTATARRIRRCPCDSGHAEQEPVLGGDRFGYGQRPDAVALLFERYRPHHVHGERAVHPPRQRSSVVDGKVVTARKHGHPGADGRRPLEHEVRERAARVSRDNKISGGQCHRFERALLERNAAHQPRPRVDQHLVKPATGSRQGGVNDQRLRRRIVENQQDLGEQAVTTGQIDDAAAAEEAPDPPRHLPCFVQLFAGQTAGVTDGAAQPVEERSAGKPLKVTIGEPSPG